MHVTVSVRWLITIAFGILVVILSVTPGRDQTDDSIFVWLIVNTPTLLQKLLHIAVYASLAFLLAWSLENVDPRPLRLAIALVLAVCLGAGLEWYQTIVPGRFGTVLDILLNAAGASIGLLAALLIL